MIRAVPSSGTRAQNEKNVARRVCVSVEGNRLLKAGGSALPIVSSSDCRSTEDSSQAVALSLPVEEATPGWEE